MVDSIPNIPYLPIVPTPPYIATNTVYWGSQGQLALSYSSFVRYSDEFITILSLRSVVLTQTIVASSESFPFIFLGVDPLFVYAKCLIFITFQCSGTSPIHSTPESLSGASGLMPRVTAWGMIFCLNSFSNSTRFSCVAIALSILPHFSSR